MDTHESGVTEGTIDENHPARKGIQPRLVFALLVGASLAGVWLSHPGERPLLRGAWWLVVVSLGALAGGLYWRTVLFETSAFEGASARQWVERRWRTLEGVGVWSFVLGGAVVLGTGGLDRSPDIGVVLLSTGVVLSPVLWFVVRRSDAADVSGRTGFLRTLLLGLLVASLGGFAWVETGTDVVDWAVRFGHVCAFALWVGGALWHNALVLPAIRSGRATAALKGQARRFRRHLLVVIPLVLLTGAYQAVQLIGISPSLLLESSIGRLIGFKLLVLVVLTGLVIVNVRKVSQSG
jgi:hypothetical protein